MAMALLIAMIHAGFNKNGDIVACASHDADDEKLFTLAKLAGISRHH